MLHNPADPASTTQPPIVQQSAGVGQRTDGRRGARGGGVCAKQTDQTERLYWSGQRIFNRLARLRNGLKIANH